MTRTACLNAVYELAKQDERVVFIGSDLSPNTMLDFKRDFPKRFFMEGVAEQNIIGMAAGLALEGFIPYVNTIATFLTRRCYDQIAVDLCGHNLPVRLLGNGGGLVYAPLGLTHCAIEDMAIMRALPNMAVVNCSDSEEMKAFMPHTLDYPGPMYIRLGKDSDPVVQYDTDDCFRMDDSRLVRTIGDDSSKILYIGTGVMTELLSDAMDFVSIPASLFHYPVIKPFATEWLLKEFDDPIRLVVTAEEGIASGGLGSAVLECLSDNNIQIPVLRLGLPDAFPAHYGEQEDLFETYGLTPAKIAERIREAYAKLSD